MGLNCLEQLCINFTNEVLQQHYVKHILQAEQIVYQEQGVAWDHVTFTDNAVRLLGVSPDVVDAQPNPTRLSTVR